MIWSKIKKQKEISDFSKSLNHWVHSEQFLAFFCTLAQLALGMILFDRARFVNDMHCFKIHCFLTLETIIFKGFLRYMAWCPSWLAGQNHLKIKHTLPLSQKAKYNMLSIGQGIWEQKSFKNVIWLANVRSY